MVEEGFLTSIRTAELFFRVCKRFKMDDRAERIALLREITRRGYAKYIRDVPEFTKGKNVLKITSKRSHNG